MAKQFNDLGLGTKVKRLVYQDGSFNIRRVGLGFTTANLYQSLIRMPWSLFLLLVTLVLFLINGVYASLYYFIGVDNFLGMEKAEPWDNYLQCFFFSFQTLFTVGYGHIAPTGNILNLLSSVEAMTGLLIFAIITGLLYGRFAKPTAKIMFSDNMLVSPYGEDRALQFRVVNKRKSTIMELTARVILSYQEKNKMRSYQNIELERSMVTLFPLNWTIVHPINEKSPLHAKAYDFLSENDAEFIVVLKGYDDTFSQEVHAIHSYRYDEIVWGGQFEPMYHTAADNTVVLDFKKLNDFKKIDIGC